MLCMACSLILLYCFLLPEIVRSHSLDWAGNSASCTHQTVLGPARRGPCWPYGVFPALGQLLLNQRPSGNSNNTELRSASSAHPGRLCLLGLHLSVPQHEILSKQKDQIIVEWLWHLLHALPFSQGSSFSTTCCLISENYFFQAFFLSFVIVFNKRSILVSVTLS